MRDRRRARTIPVTRPWAARVDVGRARHLLGQPWWGRAGCGAASSFARVPAAVGRAAASEQGRRAAPFSASGRRASTWKPARAPPRGRGAGPGLQGDAERRPLCPHCPGPRMPPGVGGRGFGATAGCEGGHPKGGGAPCQLAGQPGHSEEGGLRLAARCGRQGTPRPLVCSRPVVRLPGPGRRPGPARGDSGARRTTWSAWPLCFHAGHNAWLALPGSVIEIHCQIY